MDRKYFYEAWHPARDRINFKRLVIRETLTMSSGMSDAVAGQVVVVVVVVVVTFFSGKDPLFDFNKPAKTTRISFILET